MCFEHRNVALEERFLVLVRRLASSSLVRSAEDARSSFVRALRDGGGRQDYETASA